MLNKIQNIRAVLEVAAELERDGVSSLNGACKALHELKDIHTELMGIKDLSDEYQDHQKGGAVTNGQG